VNQEQKMSHSEQVGDGVSETPASIVQCGKSGKGCAAENAKTANEFAISLKDIVFEVLVSIKRPYRPTVVARELNRRGIATRNGGLWHPTTARRLLNRLPDVVKAASDAASAKNDFYFKLNSGADMPKSLAEVSHALGVKMTGSGAEGKP
jgi:hypothetical protein